MKARLLRITSRGLLFAAATLLPATNALPRGPIGGSAAAGPAPTRVRAHPTRTLPIQEERSTDLPARATDVAVAGCGRFLVVQTEGRQDLEVFDAELGILTGTIRLPVPDALFTAGGDRVALYDSARGAIQVWSVSTLRQTGVCPNFLDGRITNMAMGACNGNDLIARQQSVPSKVGAGSQVGLVRLGLSGCSTDKVLPPAWESAAVIMRTSPDLSRVTSRRVGISPEGLQLVRLIGTRYEAAYRHEEAGALIPSDKGRIYAGDGRVFSDDLAEVAVVPGHQLVPTLDGAFALGFNNLGDLLLFDAEPKAAIARMGMLPGAGFEDWIAFKRRWGSTPLSVEKRVVCDMRIGRCILLSLNDRTIVLRRYSLAGLSMTGAK